MIPLKILRKLARARAAIGPIERTEQGVTRDGDRWLYAAGDVIHEKTSAALREEGLELIVGPNVTVKRESADLMILEADCQLVDVSDDAGPDDWCGWTSRMPIDHRAGGKLTLAFGASLVLLDRWARVRLLDIHMPHPDESDRALGTIRGAPPRRLARPLVPEAEALDVGPRRGCADEVGDLPEFLQVEASEPPPFDEPKAAPEAPQVDEAEVWREAAVSAWAQAVGQIPDFPDLAAVMERHGLPRNRPIDGAGWRSIFNSITEEVARAR